MLRPVKAFLVTSYFSLSEVLGGLTGAFADPSYQLVSADYDAYWRHREAGSIQARFEIIETFLEPGQSMLDVGCGDGAMLEYFRELKQIQGLGLDVSSTAVALALRRNVDARVELLSDFHRSTSAGAFDHVVMSEVIEHVPDPEKFVLQGWDLAKKSLWLTFPNIAYFPHRLRLVCGRFPVQWVVFPGEHLRFWSLPDFCSWLRQLNLPAPRIYPSNGIRVLGLHKMWPNLLANQIVVRLDK